MNPRLRTILQLLPIALQFVAMAAAIGLISFMAPVTQRLIHEAEGKVAIPTPSRLFVENVGAVKIVLVALFLVSSLTMVFTRTKVKEAADRMIVESAVLSIIWYVGITILGGVVMAALLPHFALAAGGR
jgi:hypothetical protein